MISLQARCMRRFPAGDKSGEHGVVSLRFEVVAPGTPGIFGELTLRVTDPAAKDYFQEGKAYDLPMGLVQPV